MKRYEMEQTTTINNIRSNLNEVLKNLDKFGYSNFLKNNYFKNKLAYGADTLLGNWFDPDLNTDDTQSGWDYVGVKTEADKYKFYTDNSFALMRTAPATERSVAQFISFTDAERLANDGRFNLSVFFIKSLDSENLDITLEYYSALNTWTEVTELDTVSEEISTDYVNSYDLDGAAANMVYIQTTKVYDISDVAVIGGGTEQLRVKITTTDTAEWKILCNTVAYFGNMDASSFIRNNNSSSEIFTYDTDANDYYYTTDGKDKVYLSSGKYIITVGEYGQYNTLNLAIASIANDNSSFGNSRIIYLTNNTALTTNVSIPSNVTIMGNGYSIDTLTFTLNVKGASGEANLIKNVNIENVLFTSTTNANNAINMILLEYAKNCSLKNCKLDGDFRFTNPVKINNCDECDIHFFQFSDYGEGGTPTGKGIYLTTCTCNKLYIQNLLLSVTGSSTDLFGVELGIGCSDNEISIQHFEEA